MIGTILDPHGDEKTTLPLLFFTPIVKLTALDPETVLDGSDTRIAADGLAVMVPLPLKSSS